MKRTKRYGGFRIGDRVQDRRGGMEGVVVKMQRGRLAIQFDDVYHKITMMPNQLVNLTRQWEVLEEGRNQRGMREWLEGSKGLPTILEEFQKYLRERVITFSPSDLPDTPLELL